VEFQAFRRAVETDPNVAFELGCKLLAMRNHEARRHSDHAFELAAGNSVPDILWAISEAFSQHADARAAEWLRRAIASANEPNGIELDPGLLRIHTSHGYALHQDWEIRVRSDNHPRAVEALRAAEPRIMRTFEDGHEASDDEFRTNAGRLYNPNYAAVDEDVPRIWMDCKDGVMPLMAQTAIRIVSEELRSAGITRALLYTQSPDVAGAAASGAW
jgi:hypothetical protein